MSESCVLTPCDAETVVNDCIEMFGLGALPRVRVTDLGNGTWSVRWEHRECVVPAMTRPSWRAWLEDNVGSLDAENLETTES